MRALLLFVALFFGLTPPYLRTLYESQQAFERAEAFRENAKKEEMYRSYGEAVSWDSPMNTSAKEAAEILYRSVRNEELSKNDRLLAYRALYRAKMKSRDILSDQQAHQALKKELHTIAPEFADQPIRRLNKTEPNYTVQLLLQGAFWFWMLSIVYLIVRGFQADGRIVARPFLFGLVSSMLSFGLWCFLLPYA